MVSSTFYDLRQIRKDLEAFLVNQLGYECLLSELPSFPVDPGVDTVENCLRRVEEHADILVLVIGGRYGLIDESSDRSVTNLEYLTARQKGIPIYAFVSRQILEIIPVWHQNPEGSFSSVVDTTRLFEFVEQIRSHERVWTFPFDNAQDIVEVIRIQLAHLFFSTLELRKKVGGVSLPNYFEDLSPDALRIAIERPSYWEYLLFLQTWTDEVAKRSGLLREYQAGLLLGLSEDISPSEAINWLQTRLHELKGYSDAANHLMNIAARKAFGEPGQAGNAEHIIWVARKLGDVLTQALEWTSRVRRALVHEPFDGVMQQLSQFPDDMIQKLSVFPKESLQRLKDALIQDNEGEGSQELIMMLTIELTNLDGFLESLHDAGEIFLRSL